jgi:succinoglycan biosynthesis protein ExoW
MTLAVIIPFYQKTAGLLPNALRSIATQRDCELPTVIVVDDASPIAAEDEIAQLGDAMRSLSITVIKQRNAGPAAARNRGLDALGPEVTRVAFLDSDDTWSESHLAHVHEALDAGFDAFFADHWQLGQSIGAFARGGRIDPRAHPAIGTSDALHAFSGDMFDQIIRGNVIGTSTVAYAFERFRGLRFDEAYFSAGEDYLFWIALARSGARFAFSSEIEAHYGYGVNVYAGSGWGTPGFMDRIHNETRFKKRLLRFDLDDGQRKLVSESILKLRSDFAGDVVHRLGHRQPVPTDLLLAQIRLDPAILLALPICAGRLVADKIKARLRGSRA